MFQEQILQSSGLLSPAAVPRGSSVGAVEQQAAVFAQRSGVRIFEKTKVPSAEWVEKIPPSTDEHAWGGSGVGRGWGVWCSGERHQSLFVPDGGANM